METPTLFYTKVEPCIRAGVLIHMNYRKTGIVLLISLAMLTTVFTSTALAVSDPSPPSGTPGDIWFWLSNPLRSYVYNNHLELSGLERFYGHVLDHSLLYDGWEVECISNVDRVVYYNDVKGRYEATLTATYKVYNDHARWGSDYGLPYYDLEWTGELTATYVWKRGWFGCYWDFKYYSIDELSYNYDVDFDTETVGPGSLSWGGTHYIPGGSSYSITAIPDSANWDYLYRFDYWEISTYNKTTHEWMTTTQDTPVLEGYAHYDMYAKAVFYAKDKNHCQVYYDEGLPEFLMSPQRQVLLVVDMQPWRERGTVEVTVSNGTHTLSMPAFSAHGDAICIYIHPEWFTGQYTVSVIAYLKTGQLVTPSVSLANIPLFGDTPITIQ